MANNPIDGFTVQPEAIRFVGHDLQRPECVLADREGTLWASDLRGGVMRIAADGTQALLLPPDAPAGRVPNGLAFDDDGSVLIADIAQGQLQRLARNGGLQVLADQIDGRPIGKINFVLRDRLGRRWITVSTRRANWIDAVHPQVADGYIAVDDGRGWRIAADGFAFTNEARFDADESWLYVAETCGPCITRLRVGPDATLTERQTYGPARHDAFIDGITFDAFGNLWGTHVHRDRLWALTPEGELRVLLDAGGDAAAHARLMQAFADGKVHEELFAPCQGTLVPGLTSIAFGGPDRRTVFLGSVAGKRIPSFRSPVAGLVLHGPSVDTAQLQL